MLRVLYVEDNQDASDMLSQLLRVQIPGVVVATASSGPEALQMIGADQHHAFLLDLRMPGMDGVELAGRIRAECPGVPIVLYSAGATAQERELALAAGVDEYLVKPNDLDRIGVTILKLVELAASRGTGSS